MCLCRIKPRNSKYVLNACHMIKTTLNFCKIKTLMRENVVFVVSNPSYFEQVTSCLLLFVIIRVSCGWSSVVNMARSDNSKRKLNTACLPFCAKWCCLGIYVQCTHHSLQNILLLQLGAKNKQNELHEVQLVKLWMKHSVVHIPWLMCLECDTLHPLSDSQTK